MCKKKERIWIDGHKDCYETGNLLTNNFNYYGGRIKTDCECLLDGKVVPAFFDGKPKVFVGKPVTAGEKTHIEISFGASYRFCECDLIIGKANAHACFRVGNSLKEVDAEGGTEVCVMQARFPDGPVDSKLSIDLFGDNLTVSQIYAWGWEEKPKERENGEANNYYSVANSIQLQSVTGISRTAFLDIEAYDWSKKISAATGGKVKAVFSQMDPWGKLTYDPILPDPSVINPVVSMRMLRGETRSLCFALTSTDAFRGNDVFVRAADGDSELDCRIYAFGAIPSRWNGVNAGPLFDENNKISPVQMSEYLTNGEDIKDFPLLHLRPCGSVLLWIKFSLRGKTGGKREFVKRIEAGGSLITVMVKTADVALPSPKLKIGAYSRCTEMYPFRYEDRYEREAEYLKELGINIFSVGFWDWNDFYAAAARTIPDSVFSVWVFGKYGHDLFNKLICTADDITDKMREEITENVRKAVSEAERLGLDYDRWEAENADEPGVRNMGAFAEMCRLVKQIDEKVNIYANPSYWLGWDKNLVEPDERTYDSLQSWYGKYVDRSCPHVLNLTEHPKTYRLYTQPRKCNSFYDVLSQHAKCERREVIGRLRELAWIALKHNFNGWSFYAYYRPLGDPWNDLDEDLPDYSVVYPGELGPVPTRASEILREALQDYRLMKLLQEISEETYNSVLQAYECGERDFESLREIALGKIFENKQ